MQFRKHHIGLLIGSALVTVGIAFILVSVFSDIRESSLSPVDEKPKMESDGADRAKSMTDTPGLHTIQYEVGKFGPDDERKAYLSGEITLSIPRLNYEGAVLDGTATEILDEGPGLFEQAQLPGPENRNVSIAAHRDIHGMEFYDINKITDGDLIYLIYKGKKYTYQYEDSFVTTKDDWDPIRTKDYSSITLQSCTPIHVASHRIFVVGRLIEVEDVEAQR